MSRNEKPYHWTDYTTNFEWNCSTCHLQVRVKEMQSHCLTRRCRYVDTQEQFLRNQLEMHIWGATQSWDRKALWKAVKEPKSYCFCQKQKKTYIRPTHEELGTWLTSHPVDNLLRRPLCYRLHGFLDTKLPRTKMCLVIADVILQIEMMKKKKSVTLSHSRNKSVLFVCVFTRWTNVCTRGTGGWNEIPTTAPHRPAWDQRCIHELPGRLGKITTLRQNKNLVHLKMPFPASYADKQE